MAATKRKHKLVGRNFPIAYLFPNIITMAGLCVGLSAIRWAMLGRFELAATFVLVAAIIDGMDGRLARMLNATSTFGAHLDSLADFVSFGVAPVMIIYLWQLEQVRGYGWMVVLFFAVCTALRLARFNTTHIFDTPPPSAKERDKYFTGVPAPAGALLCIAPLVLYLQFGHGWFVSPYFNLAYVPLVGMLMVSTIPTFSAKKFKITNRMAAPVMVFSGVVIAGAITEPWLILLLIGFVYLALIPISYVQAKKDAKSQAE